MKVATYTRISTDEEHQPYSLEAQDGRLRLLYREPRRLGARADVHRSALRRNAGTTRPSPRNLRARAGRFDLAARLPGRPTCSVGARLWRRFSEDLDHAGVAFRSATEPFDTGSPAGRMMVQMLGVFAEFERATIIDRVIAGMERKAQKGLWCGGRDPFGYRVGKGRRASRRRRSRGCARADHLRPLRARSSRKPRARAVPQRVWLPDPGGQARGATRRCSPCCAIAPTSARSTSARRGIARPIPH